MGVEPASGFMDPASHVNNEAKFLRRNLSPLLTQNFNVAPILAIYTRIYTGANIIIGRPIQTGLMRRQCTILVKVSKKGNLENLHCVQGHYIWGTKGRGAIDAEGVIDWGPKDEEGAQYSKFHSYNVLGSLDEELGLLLNFLCS